MSVVLIIHVSARVGVTCHRGYIDNGASLLAVLFAHVLQSQVGSLDDRGLQTKIRRVFTAVN